MRFKSWLTAGVLGVVMTAGLTMFTAPAHAFGYDDWHQAQFNRLNAGVASGRISPREAHRMQNRIDHIDRNRFNDTYETWNNHYWHEHPVAWHHDGPWDNNNYPPPQQDTFDDLRDFLRQF